MDRLPEAIEIFNERKEFYKSIDIRTAAINFNNSWYNVRTRVLLLAEESPVFCKKVVDVKDFVLMHERLRADAFDEILEKISKGKLDMDNLTINFFKEPFPQLNVQDYYRGNSLESRERWKVEWPVDVYEWEQPHVLQNQLADIFKTIDMQLHRFNKPFKDVEEAVLEFLKLHKYQFQEHQMQDSKCVVLLPSFLVIDDAKLEGNKLQVVVRFHEETQLENLILSLIGYGREICRYQEYFMGAETETGSPFVRASKSFEMKDIADVQLYLFSKQIEKYGYFDQRSARNVRSTLNPRIACHEAFDRNSLRLLSWLKGEAKKNVTHSFEYSVTTLLNICGFITEWIGFHGIAEDAPDILAFCSEPELVIVGECTQEIPDVNKYKTLKERAEKLQNHVGINTVAVMFTSINASEDEKGQAWKYDVAFVGSDKLKEIHDMATRNKPIREILYSLTGRSW